MKIIPLLKKIGLVTLLSSVSVSAAAQGAKVTALIKQQLPDLKNQEALMLTVEYGPGMSSKAHRHEASIFVYVLEGSVTMQLAGSEPVTLLAGDTFYESEQDIHLVSKNASSTESAKMVVFSVKNKNLPVLIPIQ